MAGISSLRALVPLVARLVVAGAFAMAALPKIHDPVAFAGSVSAFRVVGPALSAWVALVLPWLELVTAIGLLTPWLRRSSGLCINLLLLAFIALQASAWARGLDIDCGCFGTKPAAAKSSHLWPILRNSALLLAAAYLFARDLLRNKERLKRSQ